MPFSVLHSTACFLSHCGASFTSLHPFSPDQHLESLFYIGPAQSVMEEFFFNFTVIFWLFLQPIILLDEVVEYTQKVSSALLQSHALTKWKLYKPQSMPLSHYFFPVLAFDFLYLYVSSNVIEKSWQEERCLLWHLVILILHTSSHMGITSLLKVWFTLSNFFATLMALKQLWFFFRKFITFFENQFCCLSSCIDFKLMTLFFGQITTNMEKSRSATSSL